MSDDTLARIDALGDFGRKSALKWLAGYAPEAVAAALDEMDRQAAGERPGDASAWCGRCRRTTLSTPCPRCGGPACARCGRCPPCDGPVPDEEET